MLFLILIVKYIFRFRPKMAGLFRFRLFFAWKIKFIFRLLLFYGRKSKIHFRSASSANLVATSLIVIVTLHIKQIYIVVTIITLLGVIA